MSQYTAPVRDMQFVMQELAGVDQVSQLPGYEEAAPDVISAILDEAARFSGEVLAPLNKSGDREGARWQDGVVRMPQGFGEAYGQFVENGWNGIGCDMEFGGQGMPKLLVAAVQEMWMGANISFSLCPLLATGAIEALTLCGSDALKHAYLPKMVSGSWSGTMNLTEPQAGSDLAAVRTRAVPQPDGSYRISGQKIFITYGEHDMAENIVHLVLARTPDAPEGVKGISLFVVPKFIPNADGAPGEHNDLRCVSIEHKLGIHASPTCVMSFGDHGGALGYLCGEENRGLEYMFIMMNAARFAVGLQGLAVAERAYQQALAYAKERVQGAPLGVKSGARVSIIHHPDVRRMLMLMKSQVEAMRALAGVTAAAQDAALHHPDAAERKRNQAFVDLMIPIVKGWNTETGVEVASLGVQVHGGMGYIEETGAAQHLRDARITTIYEGTTGIQGNDLVGRKILRDGGASLHALLGLIDELAAELGQQTEGEFAEDLAAIRTALGAGVAAARAAASYMLANAAQQLDAVFAGAVPMLKLLGVLCGGWQMARAALAARQRLQGADADAAFYRAKIGTARFFADHVLSQAPGLAHAVVNGAAGTLRLAEEDF